MNKQKPHSSKANRVLPQKNTELRLSEALTFLRFSEHNFGLKYDVSFHTLPDGPTYMVHPVLVSFVVYIELQRISRTFSPLHRISL